MVKKKSNNADFHMTALIGGIIIVFKGIDEFVDVMPRLSEKPTIGLVIDIVAPLVLFWIGASLIRFVTNSNK